MTVIRGSSVAITRAACVALLIAGAPTVFAASRALITLPNARTEELQKRFNAGTSDTKLLVVLSPT